VQLAVVSMIAMHYSIVWCEQNMEYKFVELLSCQFQASSEEHIKQQVTYRYNAVKSRLALMQARLADINALVRHSVLHNCACAAMNASVCYLGMSIKSVYEEIHCHC